MKGDIRKALDYLSTKKIRASYDAVRSYLGFGTFDRVEWDEILGPARPYTSWVVNKKTGMPTGHQPTELDPDLMINDEIVSKGKLLQAAILTFSETQKSDPSCDSAKHNTRKVVVADCHGNNAAVICPSCKKAYLISGFLNKGARSCPHCGKSRAVFAEVKTEWEETHQDAAINPEQVATRLVFKKDWLGYDVWVSFTEDGTAYRYPHDQLLQAFISRLAIIEGTKSWDNDGAYSFPRLSGEQKKMLQRYMVGVRNETIATQAAETEVVIPEAKTAPTAEELLDS